MSESKQTDLFGRPQSVTREQVLKAIHDHHTQQPSKLAKILKVEATTIYRRFKGDKNSPPITDNDISEALGISGEKDLPPSMLNKEKGYELFRELPLIKDYNDSLVYHRNMSKEKAKTRLRMLWRICKYTHKKPSALTPEDVSQIVTDIRKGDPDAVAEFKGGYDLRIAARAFFTFTGIAGQKLTSMGIGAELYEQSITRAQTKLSREQRATIMAEIAKRNKENWRSKNGRAAIPFRDQPELARAIEIYPKIAYYIGIRATSAFEKAFWELAEERDERQFRTKFSGVTVGASGTLSSFKTGDEIWFRHLDKGKRGGKAWTKRIFGKFAAEFIDYWKSQGKPQTGLVFAGLTDYNAREFLKECYEAAAIPQNIWKGSFKNEPMPLHIWRHTAAQDLLDATEWNADLVATQLGWESTDILKKSYGSIPPDVQRRLVLKAQGEHFDEKPKEFIF